MIQRYKGFQPKPVTIRPCKNCGGLGHTAFNCPKRPRKPLQSRQGLKTTKPMRKVGKYGKINAQVSREFRKNNQPNHEGYHVCFYCGKWIEPAAMNPEHTNSKARHPEDRTDQGKLVKACTTCNQRKGSLGVEEFKELLQKEKSWQEQNKAA